ncbi:VanZ like family protein [Bremerella volcania]|uniref:VanZ like family protein n=1 Tax=Bremerella volcania TaxID=2527984 RepID=A0A518CD86_9BACT|nr:VanZ family protein [Bremerella volcania]QDU77187.1 VanZ like family protein [Bremerella volcania]
MSLRKVPLIATLVLFGLWAIAFTATHWPMEPDNDPLFPHVDKFVHAGIYAILAITALFAATAWNYRWSLLLAVTVALALVGVGMFDELTQLFVAGRTADPLDLVADTFGAVVGISLYGLVRGGRGSEELSASESP